MQFPRPALASDVLSAHLILLWGTVPGIMENYHAYLPSHVADKSKNATCLN